MTNRLIALGMLVLLAPLLGMIALAVYLDSGRPIFFIHPRLCQPSAWKYRHRHNMPWGVFDCIKFRTMQMMKQTDLTGTTQWTLCDGDPRITKVGAWLRRWSLDELPQLLNIMQGDMNFIGPRPLLIHQAPAVDSWAAPRFAVKPGITGYAQVRGRNAIPWAQRIELDVWYVRHRTWRLDAWILWRTLAVWWTGKWLYGPGGVNSDVVD